MAEEAKKTVEKVKDTKKFAVIESGSKQYLIKEGQKIEVETIDEAEGNEITLDALLVGNDKEVKVGKPVVTGASVKAKVLGDVKGDKLIVFKYKSKKNERTKTGHRQKYTELEITDIKL